MISFVALLQDCTAKYFMFIRIYCVFFPPRKYSILNQMQEIKW